MSIPKTSRISAEYLNEIATVCRKHGIIDMASGDTRIILSANAPILTSTGINVDPLKPIEAQQSPMDRVKLTEEEEEILFASSGGPPP